MGWILGYKGKCWWLCGVIDHAEQHIQSTVCLGYGFVVIVWVSAFDFRDGLADLRKMGSGTRMEWIFGLIPPCWWLCGVIDHAEQHIQRWDGEGNGFMMNIDLVVNFIVVEWRIAWNGERESLTWFVFDEEWAYLCRISCDYNVF